MIDRNDLFGYRWGLAFETLDDAKKFMHQAVLRGPWSIALIIPCFTRFWRFL